MRNLNLLGTAVIGLVIGLWEVAARWGPLADLDALPSPGEIVAAFGELLSDGSLIPAVVHTLWIALLAAVVAISAGTVLGLLLGASSAFRLVTQSSFDVLRTIPAVSIMPVLLLLLGPEPRTEIIAGSIAATWPMLVNAADGVRSVHPRLAEVGQVFGFSRTRVAVRLTLPAVVPNLLVGARLAVVTALLATLLAEMISVPTGLGWALISAQNAIQMAQMWVVVVVCGWIGWLLSIALTQIARNLQPGGAR